MYCKVTLIGNLGKDPVMRAFPDGTPIASFSVATSEKWKSKAGEKQERTTWVPVEVMGKLAEICREYLHKGSKVFIEGALRVDEWEKDGTKHYRTKVVLQGPGSKMLMLDTRAKDDSYPSRTAAERPADDFQVSDDDVPFAIVPFLVGLVGLLRVVA